MENTLQFLKTIKENNSKECFELNRPIYELAKKEIISVGEQLIKGISEFDSSIETIKAKDCIFRINRDVRFGKDKSPYKTNMGVAIQKEGKKSYYAGYYLHIEPGASFVGGGLYMPMPDKLKKLRQEIDYCSDEFLDIVTNPAFVSTLGQFWEQDKLIRVPKGYLPENKMADYLKLKHFVLTQKLEDKELLSPNVLYTKCMTVFKELATLNQFINNSLKDN